MWKAFLGLLGFLAAYLGGHLFLFPPPEGSHWTVGARSAWFYLPLLMVGGYVLGFFAGIVLDRRRPPERRTFDVTLAVASACIAAGLLFAYFQGAVLLPGL
jgi:hypothetical protein